jgi:hypothetical protein
MEVQASSQTILVTAINLKGKSVFQRRRIECSLIRAVKVAIEEEYVKQRKERGRYTKWLRMRILIWNSRMKI